MNILEMELGELKPYERNPRRNDDAVQFVANSIKEFGFKVPIVVDKDNVIVAGHTRYKAAKKLKLKTVPVIIADDLTDEQIKAYRLADNKVAEAAEWDDELLNLELDDIFDIDMGDFGFFEEETEHENKYDEGQAGSLAEKYIVPPFSVLHTTNGKWAERKRTWKQYITSGDGRDENVLGSGLDALSKNGGMEMENAGVSIFDPVLTETLIKWFCPKGGMIIDPFTGGSVRGLVSAFTGHDYVGVDLRQEQIDANEEGYRKVELMEDFFGEPLRHPTWICGDSCNIDTMVDGKYDFMLTCPPYADLEVYSDDERDLSNMEYPQFVEVYREIIRKTTEKLKDNTYAAIVIGEVRGKDGNYYNFVGDTIKAFLDAGLHYYNEIILETAVGTAALRANRTFGTYRKVVKTHQNVLVFVKGDPKKVVLEEYDYEFPDEAEEPLD